jgi:DNA-binding response OmpR family regulator
MENKTTRKPKSPKILLVDDEVAILNALGIYFKQQGYNVEALAKFHNYLAQLTGPQLPDIIVLDILLNKENGAKIAKQLKANPRTKGIPIIMISAIPDGKKLSDEAGADAFLAKPFDLDELNELVEKLAKKTA